MANQAIVEWLRKNLQAGYDLGTLRNTLLHHGYRIEDIDAAVHAIYGVQEVKHTLHLSRTTTILVVAVVFSLLLSIGAAFYILTPKVPAQLLDVSLELFNPSVQSGQNLNFNVELTSMGSSQRYDVVLRYTLEKDGTQVNFKEETVAVETSKSYKTFINVTSDLQPGDYTLRLVARYNGKVARASSVFKVVKQTAEASCFDGIRNQDETDVDCGGQCQACATCSDGIRNQGETAIDCGGPCQP